MTMLDWGLLAKEWLYLAGLAALVVLALVALLRTARWISVFEAVLLLVVCVSAVDLFERPPRSGVVGLVVAAALLCGSVFRRWRLLEARRAAAAQAAGEAAAGARAAAAAAGEAASAMTDSAEASDSEPMRRAAAVANEAAVDAVLGAARATQAARDAGVQQGNDDAGIQ